MKTKTEFHPDHESAPSRFRCWDGLIGCEQNKPETEFRWHPLICSQCCAATSARYGFKQSDIGYLSLLLSVDASLIRELAYAKAPRDKIDGLKRGQEIHLKRLHESILKANGDQGKVKTTMVNYREWFREQAFGEHVHIPADSSLPTADRK